MTAIINANYQTVSYLFYCYCYCDCCQFYMMMIISLFIYASIYADLTMMIQSIIIIIMTIIMIMISFDEVNIIIMTVHFPQWYFISDGFFITIGQDITLLVTLLS